MTAAAPPAFSRVGLIGLVVGGFALFLAMLYLIGAGESFGGEQGSGQAHAASNGLNGYAGLVQLVEAQGYDVERSRSPEGLKTNGLLVLTPTAFADPDQIDETMVGANLWTDGIPDPDLVIRLGQHAAISFGQRHALDLADRRTVELLSPGFQVQHVARGQPFAQRHCAAVRRHGLVDLAARHAVPLNTMRTWLRRSLLKLKECLES